MKQLKAVVATGKLPTTSVSLPGVLASPAAIAADRSDAATVRAYAAFANKH